MRRGWSVVRPLGLVFQTRGRRGLLSELENFYSRSDSQTQREWKLDAVDFLRVWQSGEVFREIVLLGIFIRGHEYYKIFSGVALSN